MKNNYLLFFFFLVVLFFPVIGQASTTILTSTSPDHIATSGSDAQVYGTSASNQITLESGAKVELINFPGSNSIVFDSDAALFTVYRSGTVVTFQGSDETILKIPATKNIQTVSFNGEESRVLHIHDNQVMLDDQEITTIAAEIEGGQEEPVTCGAYVAPGVWKEFDCYNLAAIGKTTGDYPFTPSWRLIGGYWQWGRKGPEPSQWDITNTNHFAHGPAGPGENEANEKSITGWDWEKAPDGAWSDNFKTNNDPCPDGYRVPTIAQWEGVLDNNTQSEMGTWPSNDDTNYNSAQFFGDDLMLPAAGYRLNSGEGCLNMRGGVGYYWSSSEHFSNWSSILRVKRMPMSDTSNSDRRNGSSIRCIAE